MEDCVLSIDSTRAVSKKAADSGFFRPRMILLVLVTHIQTLDSASGGVPAAEPSFRAGLCEEWEFFFLSIDSACAVSKKAAEGSFFRPQMISLVLVSHIQTLDFCRGASPLARLESGESDKMWRDWAKGLKKVHT